MKLSKVQVFEFQKNILEFYNRDSGSKPWNQDKNPYKIWVFEVVMQQTRLDQGYPYFEKLMSKFPSINDLANVSEDDLFAVWKGLGYYSRARNLQFTAKFIVNELQGEFPKTYSDLLKLKGVGEYTAAAIASFAFGQDIAVLDGNVHRVLSRIFGISRTIQLTTDKKYFQDLLSQLLVVNQPAIFNQAMMDMGSQVCKPQNPNCDACFFMHDCIAYQQDRIKELPPKKVKPVMRDRYFYCLFVEYRGKIYVEKRTENDIWKGLYQGIMQEGQHIDETYWSRRGIDVSKVEWSEWHRQLLSHQRVFMKLGKIKVKSAKNYTLQTIEKNELSVIPLPRVVSRFLESIE